MTVAFNPETGKALRLDDSGQWVDTQTATNPQTGETLAYDGRQWSKVNTKPERSTLESVGNYVDGTVRSIANGLTFGFADEIAAGASSATGIGEQAGPGSTYEQNLAAERGRDQSFGDEYPITSTVGEMGGAVAGTVVPMGLAARTLGTGAKAGPLVSKLMTPATSMTGKMAQGATAGATAGGAYGFGTGEGGFGPRMENAGTGAAVGGAAGFALPPIVSGIGKGVNAVARWAGGRSAAERKVLENIMRDFPGMDEQQAIRAAEARLRELGPEGALMDVGTNTRGAARSAYTIPGEGKTKIGDFLTARQEGTRGVNNVLEGGQINRITQGMDDIVPGQYGNTQRRALETQRGNAARPLYQSSANDLANVIPEERFAPLMQDGVISAEIKKITGNPLYGLGDAPPNSLAVLDAVKKSLDDQINTARRQGANNQARLLEQRKQALTDLADDVFPDYQKAREVYAEFSDVIDAGDLGKKFMRGDIDDLKDAVSRMEPNELAQLRIGAAQAIRDKLSSLNTRSDATKRVMDIPALENKIRTVFGDDETYSRYIDMLKNERTMFESYGAIKGGSRTGEVLAEQADTGIDKGRVAEGVMDVLSPTSGSMSRVRGVGDIVSGLKDRATISPKMSSQMGDILTGQGTERLQRRVVNDQYNEMLKNRLTRLLLGGGVAGGAQANR